MWNQSAFLLASVFLLTMFQACFCVEGEGQKPQAPEQSNPLISALIHKPRDAIPRQTLMAAEHGSDLESHGSKSGIQMADDGGKAPWMVFLAFYKAFNDPSDGLTCSGSLISRDYVLTAASCLFSPVSGKRFGACIAAFGGSASDPSEESVTTVFCSRFRPHEGFKPSSSKHDIALVKLERPVTLSDDIQVITLSNKKHFQYTGFPVHLAGWDVEGNGNDISTDIKLMETDFQSDCVCDWSWNCPNTYRLYNSSVQTCYGGSGSNSICNLQVGGPVVVGTGSNAVQIAIHSFVRSPGSPSGNPSCPSRANRDGMCQTNNLQVSRRSLSVQSRQSNVGQKAVIVFIIKILLPLLKVYLKAVKTNSTAASNPAGEFANMAQQAVEQYNNNPNIGWLLGNRGPRELGCGDDLIPAVGTKVAAYLGWIYSNMA